MTDRDFALVYNLKTNKLMRNSVNIFWGRKTSDVLLLMHKYMLHSAEGDTEIFFRSYLYSKKESISCLKNANLRCLK